MSRRLSRRRILKGMLGGTAISVGLPLFECLLDTHGEALANGIPLPQRFGTWFWGCGMNPDRWIPQNDGSNFELPAELQAIAPLREHINILSGFDTILDGVPNIPHHTGVVATLSGVASGVEGEFPAPSLDILISDALGDSTRFRSLELSADGVREHSYSRRNTSIVNQSEVSPVALYQRLFGTGFRAPGEDFEPDPKVLLRQSVLSAVLDESKRLNTQLGTQDRARLDQYFTSVRELEQRLILSSSAPPPLEGCARPDEPEHSGSNGELETVQEAHAQLSQLLAMALACDQTRVFNMLFSWGLSELRHAGTNATQHDLTHNEAIDPVLGYQPVVTEYILAAMDAWSAFVATLAAIPEGAGSLLDNCLVLAHSESSFAQAHQVTNIPVMTAGRAGGLLNTGLHIRGNGSPVTRVGLTAQQIMGLSTSAWGQGSLATDQPIRELLA